MIESPVPTHTTGLLQQMQEKIAMLQRLDAQLADLLIERKCVQDELNDMQSQINKELDRLVNDSQQLHTQILGDEPDNSDRVQLADYNNN